MEPMYLSIQPKKTGERIRKLLLEKGYTIREIQGAFGFENPQGRVKKRKFFHASFAYEYNSSYSS